MRVQIINRLSLEFASVVLTLVWWPAMTSSAQSPDVEDLQAFPRTTVEITPEAPREHGRGEVAAPKHRFDVWVADTSPRLHRGLMFVRDLPATRGMLFPHDPPRVANFWMKNTYIELDMIFVGTDGNIIKIIERAQPLKLDNLSSDLPVSAVLEIKGGEAAKQGLRVGDFVSWKPWGNGRDRDHSTALQQGRAEVR
jgi:uncharacterized membrane protein (UPF0127 family)